ncbi:follicle-stimulating hormone receptor-like isoform X3 [Montipora foliosa]|uniref:follicle-stimulating hormone receptor-like isoform X3 n=1 Tax=Montipora foliosa TaxID=591990 RepID=UPI0035F173C7
MKKRLLYLFCFMEKLLLSCRLFALLFAQCQPPSVRSRHEPIAVGSGVELVNKLSLGRTFSGRWCGSNVTYECVVAIENFLHALFPSDSRKEKNAVSGASTFLLAHGNLADTNEMLLAFTLLPILAIFASAQAITNCSVAQHMEFNSTIVKIIDNGCKTFWSEPCHKTEIITELRLSGNKIETLNSNMFTCLKNLENLYLERNLITNIERNTFSGLTKLKQLYLNHNNIKTITPWAFDNCSLITLCLEYNQLLELPVFGRETGIKYLEMTGNPIKRLNVATLAMYTNLTWLYIGETNIAELPGLVFEKNKKLDTLDLQETKISHLPGKNLESLQNFTIKGAKELYEIPIVSFVSLKKAVVEYPFHCCLITTMKHYSPEVGTQPPTSPGTSRSGIICPSNLPTLMTTGSTSSTTTATAATSKPNNASYSYERNERRIVRLHPNECVDPSNFTLVTMSPPIQVNCTAALPEDVFNPCGDLLGSQVLRVCSWIAMVFAVLGNSFKLFVLFMSKRKISITKILMCNLAFANLCMGLFLCMLVIADRYSLGEYQNFAYRWQYLTGCKVAGFVSIFSTELAVFVLTIITVERYFTIVHPLQREKHLSIKQIVVLIAIGWIFSITLAALPLLQVGVSSYEKVAICLPFEVKSTLSKIYVTFLLATNGLAFFFVLFCYGRMYCSLGLSGAGDSGHRVETRVAKRMAMLVITNFACWFPIALLSLIAIYGKTLINVRTAQFFLVFVYPINSFTNPYLYAMGTKHFQLDALEIISRLGICDSVIKKLRGRLQDQLEVVPNSSRAFTGSRMSLSSMRFGDQIPVMSGRNNNHSLSNGRGSSKNTNYNGGLQSSLNSPERLSEQLIINDEDETDFSRTDTEVTQIELENSPMIPTLPTVVVTTC